MFWRCELWQDHVKEGCFPDCDMLPLGKVGKGFETGERDCLFTREEQKTMMTLCIGTGVGNYQFYCDRPCVTNDLHGVGAFLLMCTELQVAENVCAQNR